MRQRIRVVYWAVLALRREYSIMELDVSNNNRTAELHRPDLSRKPGLCSSAPGPPLAGQG